MGLGFRIFSSTKSITGLVAGRTYFYELTLSLSLEGPIFHFHDYGRKGISLVFWKQTPAGLKQIFRPSDFSKDLEGLPLKFA